MSIDRENKDLNCEDCGTSFRWDLREQRFYETKGFKAPKRCPECRRRRKLEREAKEST